MSVVLTRRNRRYATQPKSWEPTIRNPYRGLIVWPTPELLEFQVTLFRDRRSQIHEDKDWLIVIEDVGNNGKRRQVASATINMSKYAEGDITVPVEYEIVKLPLISGSKKVKQAHITLTLTCQFIREGKAT